MTLTDVAAPTTIDTQEAASLVDKVKSLSLLSALKIVLLIVVLIVLVKLLTKIFAKLLGHSHIDKSLHGFLKTGMKIFLYFVAVTIVAGSLSIDVTSLIAVLSVAGLAMSLALQGALSNVASGIVILTTKPLHVGDFVAIGDSEGAVEEIGMTYTQLATLDRKIIFIPNSIVTSTNVINYTIEGKRRVELKVNVGYDSDIDVVKSSILEAVAAIPAFFTDPPVFARVSGYGESAIEYTVRAWCTCDDYWDCYYGLTEEIKRTFDRCKIEMTYPHLNVHMVND